MEQLNHAVFLLINAASAPGRLHFPLDMAGSAVVAAASAALVRRYGSPVIAPLTQILARAHGNLLAPWIRCGRVRK